MRIQLFPSPTANNNNDNYVHYTNTTEWVQQWRKVEGQSKPEKTHKNIYIYRKCQATVKQSVSCAPASVIKEILWNCEYQGATAASVVVAAVTVALTNTHTHKHRQSGSAAVDSMHSRQPDVRAPMWQQLLPAVIFSLLSIGKWKVHVEYINKYIICETKAEWNKLLAPVTWMTFKLLAACNSHTHIRTSVANSHCCCCNDDEAICLQWLKWKKKSIN